VQPTDQPMITVVNLCKNRLGTHVFEECVSNFVFEGWVFFDPEDGGNRPPPYVSTYLPDFTVLHPSNHKKHTHQECE
jgi:hypothetical protein